MKRGRKKGKRGGVWGTHHGVAQDTMAITVEKEPFLVSGHHQEKPPNQDN